MWHADVLLGSGVVGCTTADSRCDISRSSSASISSYYAGPAAVLTPSGTVTIDSGPGNPRSLSTEGHWELVRHLAVLRETPDSWVYRLTVWVRFHLFQPSHVRNVVGELVMNVGCRKPCRHSGRTRILPSSLGSNDDYARERPPDAYAFVCGACRRRARAEIAISSRPAMPAGAGRVHGLRPRGPHAPKDPESAHVRRQSRSSVDSFGGYRPKPVFEARRGKAVARGRTNPVHRLNGPPACFSIALGVARPRCRLDDFPFEASSQSGLARSLRTAASSSTSGAGPR